MIDKPQFTQKAILGVTAALSVVFLALAHGDPSSVAFGAAMSIPVVCGSIAYLWRGGSSAIEWFAIGWMLNVLLVALVTMLQWWFI